MNQGFLHHLKVESRRTIRTSCQLTWFRLQVPLGALFSLDELVNVFTGFDVLCDHVSRADKFVLVCCKVLFARFHSVDKVCLRTFANAGLGGWTTIEWHKRISAFGQVEEHKILLINDFTVLTALISVGVAWHQQTIQITFTLSFKYILN